MGVNSRLNTVLLHVLLAEVPDRNAEANDCSHDEAVRVAKKAHKLICRVRSVLRLRSNFLSGAQTSEACSNQRRITLRAVRH